MNPDQEKIVGVANIVASLHNLARCNDSLIGFVHVAGLRAQNVHHAINVIFVQDEEMQRQAKNTPKEIQSSGFWQKAHARDCEHFNRAISIGLKLKTRVAGLLTTKPKTLKYVETTPAMIGAVMDVLAKRRKGF